MSVVPKQSKRVSVRSGKREQKGRCLVDDKCDVVCEPPISFPEEEQPAPVEVPVEVPVIPVIPDDSSPVSPILEAIVEEVVPVLEQLTEDVAVRVLSECKTKVWNAVTKRWLKLDGKKAKQLGL
jgi:hypothetical protein